MIKLTIDDKEIEFEKPVTVLAAAESAGIKIPTLCNFEGLKPIGGCRLCLVEVERIPGLQASCTLMAADGMVIRTETEQVRSARRAMLEFLLINHPLDCPYCDKAGECELQDLAERYGPETGRFSERKRTQPESVDDPFIVRNMERCVRCTRCVRVCDDQQGAYAISVIGRGGRSVIEPFDKERYDCEYCGNCLTVCPVGAIMSKLHRYSYRAWFVEKEVETICGFCGVGCTLFLQLRGNSIIRTMPKVGHGLNNGLLCVRGRFGYDFIENQERLTTPLMRVDGELRPVSWEDAISFAAKRLKEVRSSNGGESIGAIASGRCTNEDNYMLQKLTRFIIGSNNIDSTARCYYAPAESFLERMFGQGITANLIPDIANSDGIFVAGGDPTAINPVLGIQIRAAWKKGAKVLVMGPPGGLKRFTDYDLVPPLFSDELMLSAIVGRLVKERGLSGENRVIEGKLEGLQVPSDEELTSVGILPEILSRTSDALSRMTTPVVVIGPDIIQRSRPSKNLFLLGAIAYITNARIFLLSEKPNYQGLMDMGCLPDALPGGRPLDLEIFKHKIEDAMDLKVPTSRGHTLFEMIDKAGEGELKALYVMGENPLHNLPGRERVEDAFQKLDLLIVQDIFMTDTARIADLVLPATGWSEKDGTFSNLGRRLQRVRKGRSAESGRDDWMIIADIARQLGMEKTYASAEDVWEEITHVSPLHDGLSYSDMEGDNSIWPYYGEPLRGVGRDFAFEETEGSVEIPDADTQYLLQERPLFHPGTQSGRSKGLLNIYPEAALMVNPSLMEGLGLSGEERVKITTEKGSLVLKVRLEADIPHGQVLLSNTFEGSGFMGMAGYSVDPVLGCMRIDENRVRLERVQ